MNFTIARAAFCIASFGSCAACAVSAQSDGPPGAVIDFQTQRPGTANLVLTLNTDGAGGAVMIAIFADAGSYNAGKPLRGVRAPVSSTSMTERVEGLEPGTYAIRSFHDANGDGVLNTNPFGAPVEPFAFSRGAKPKFGPPAWEDASIDLAPGDNAETLNFQQ